MAHIRVLKHYFHVPFLLLGILEFLILLASVYLAAWFRFDNFLSDALKVGSLLPRALLFSILVTLSMTALGVYQARTREGMSGVMLRTGVSYFLAATALSFIFYLFPALYLGRGVFILATFISFFSVFVVRIMLARLIDDQLLKRRVLVLGAGRRAKLIEDRMHETQGERGFVLCGFIAVPEEDVEVEPGRIVPFGSGNLLQLAEQYDVDELVVAIDDRRRYFPMKELLDCKMGGIDVLDIINFFEREGGQIEVGLLHPSWLVFSDGFMYGASRAAFERGFDILASTFLLLLSWPVMLGTVLAIWWEEGIGAEIFYRQKRVGLNENPFFVYKFRSMRVDAEKSGAQWASSSDDRITRVGRFIRKYRIDELPQMLNVLKGDMGFVGPRPERPEFVTQLVQTIPFYADRHRVKPGITGWAQLRYPYGASEEDAKMKLKYDLYYVKNHSLMLDLLILIQTVEVVLFGKGAR